LFNLARSFKGERNAEANPWGGVTLEWTIPSTQPLHNFTSQPEVLDYPYDFSGVVESANKH